jgi:hypothetical protein
MVPEMRCVVPFWRDHASLNDVAAVTGNLFWISLSCAGGGPFSANWTAGASSSGPYRPGDRIGIRPGSLDDHRGGHGTVFLWVLGRPVASLSRPSATFVTRPQPLWLPARTLVSYRINRQLSGWNLPPLVIRAFGAHCQNRTFDASQLSRHEPASEVTTPNLRLQHRALSHSRLPKHPWTRRHRRAGKI